MIQKDLLWGRWNIWFSYYLTEEQKKESDYNDTLRKVHSIEKLADIVYLLSNSPLSDLTRFFVTTAPEGSNNICPTYQIDGKSRKVNAVNYFRDGVEPTWEDESNAKGGRLIFQIDKEEEKHQEIHHWLVLYFLGESENCAQDINGLRFISSKPDAPIRMHYRVEVWTKFDESDLQKVKSFKQTFVMEFLKEYPTNNFKALFKNNK